MSQFTLGVVNVRGGECRGGECRTIPIAEPLLSNIQGMHNFVDTPKSNTPNPINTTVKSPSRRGLQANHVILVQIQYQHHRGPNEGLAVSSLQFCYIYEAQLSNTPDEV